MKYKIHVHKRNETYLRIDCERSIQQEIKSYFSYKVDNADHITRVKGIKNYSGKKSVFNLKTRQLYVGLLPTLKEFAKKRGYPLILDFKEEPPFKVSDLDQFASIMVSSLNLPFTPYDYQIAAIAAAIENKRLLINSPTGSGKSFIIYGFASMLAKVIPNPKILIIDPTITLVNQMRSDFIEYNGSPDDIQIIKGGQTKEITKPITISTWQSLQDEPSEYLNQFDCVIADEVHLFKAHELSGIIERCSSVKFKIGLTATLEDTLMAKLILEGLFGKVHTTATIRELIERGILSDFEVKVIILNHTEHNRKLCSRMNYDEEVEYICMNAERNKFITDLANNCDENTLILFRFIGKHGDKLYSLIESTPRNKPYYYIHGKVKENLREEYRKEIIATGKNDILASFQTFSFGVNVPNIASVILGSPVRSRIVTLQTIGRGLRRSKNKIKTIIYDIGDNLAWKSKNNKTMEHLVARVELYAKEQFKYTMIQYNLKKDQEWNLSD